MTLMIATPPVTWTSHPQTAAFLLRWQSATSLRTCPCVSPVFPRCASKGSNERTQKHMRAHAHAIASKPARTRPLRGFAATRSASTRERMCARTYIRMHTCAHLRTYAHMGARRRWTATPTRTARRGGYGCCFCGPGVAASRRRRRLVPPTRALPLRRKSRYRPSGLALDSNIPRYKNGENGGEIQPI